MSNKLKKKTRKPNVIIASYQDTFEIIRENARNHVLMPYYFDVTSEEQLDKIARLYIECEYISGDLYTLEHLGGCIVLLMLKEVGGFMKQEELDAYWA